LIIYYEHLTHFDKKWFGSQQLFFATVSEFSGNHKPGSNYEVLDPA